MPPIVVDVSTKTLLVAALIVMLGALTVFGGVLFGFADSQPEVLEGNFVDTGGSGLLAVADSQSCSTDGDCPSTTCDGDNYLVDTDGEVSCIDHNGDGTTECAGYDKTYADAEYCGGRYDYNCDSTGCEGYKAACEDDCSANSGCDTYDFCGDDDDSSSGSSGSDTSSCTDACESLTKKCSDGNVVQCQDTDSDSCTDEFVKIDDCDGDCENAACADTSEEPQDTDEDTAEETMPEDGTDTDTDSQTLDERIAEVWTGVWTTLFGWM